MNIVFILFTITIINENFNFLADQLILGKASSELNEVVEPALSIGCHKVPNIRNFCISINVSPFFTRLLDLHKKQEKMAKMSYYL